MKKITQKGLTILFVLALTNKISAQLSGTYNVPATYTSIGAAIADLNTNGVNGPVTINIAAGYIEVAPIGGYTLNTITGASAVNQITFQKSGAGINPLITAYTGGTATPASTLQDGVWRFSGTDFVTIDGIDILDPNTTNPATMEFGYGFFKASVTDGCQNNTIRNCVITLSRVNNATGSGPAVDGSRGIDVVNATYTANTTALTITSASGGNSNNKFYSNTIQNCNIGIALIGFAASTPFTNADYGNDVGGSSALTGNTIINFGGGGNVSAAAGIRTLAQYTLNVSYNVINNNNGNGVSHAHDLRDIYLNTATSAGAVINNNTITLVGGGTTNQLTPIQNASGATAASNTIAITNNLINNCRYTTATSGVFYGIYNTASSAYLSIANNTLTNNSTNATSGSYYNIYNTGAVTTTIDISNNIIGLGTFSATSTSLELAGIYNSGGATTSTLNVLNNVLQSANFVGTIGGTGQNEMIYNTGTRGVTNFIGNNFNNVTLKSSGTTYLMYNSNSTTITNTNNNFITTGFSRTVSGSNNFYGYYNFGGPGSGTATFIGNALSNITMVGAGTFYGLYQATSTSQNEVFTNNLVSNITATSSVINALYHNYGAASSAITGNTVTNIVGASVNAVVIGNSSGALGLNVSDNVVSSCTAVAASGQAVGIFHVNGSASTVFRNKVYDLSGMGTANIVRGIHIGGGGSLTIYNNLIGDLKTPFSGGTSISGLYLGAATNVNVSYNTVSINAVSNGLDFGSVALYASSSPVVTLRNNVFVNNSIPTGTGRTIAYNRSSSTISTYSVGSNNNLFYAGVPSPSRLIFYDGTNAIQSLGAYKGLMSTRDGLSVTENPTFLSVVGSSPNFLNIDPLAPTQIESGAVVVSGLTTDYAGTTRNASTPDIGAWEGNYTGVPVCSGQPAITSLVSSQAAVCPSVSFNLSSSTSYTNSGITYQWSASTTGSVSGFSPIANATLAILSFTDLPTATWYQLDVTCASSGSVFSSAPVSVLTGPPLINAVSNTTFMCQGQSANLSIASPVSGVSYQWLTSTTNSVSGFSPIANATLSTRSNTGTVGFNWFTTVISCTANPSFSVMLVPVNVNVGQVPTALASASSASLCASSNLSLTGTTDVGLNYSWTGPSGFTSNLQSPVITNAGSGTYSFVAALNSCSSTVSSVSVTTAGRLFLNTPVATPSNICLGGATQLQVNDYVASRVNTYSFIPSAGASLVTMSSGSVNVIGSSVDDAPMAAPAAIGFSFNYDGNTYTQFTASPDGWVMLGGAIGSNQFTNLVTSTTNIPKLYPYWDDLATGTDGSVRTQLIGTAPSRTLVIEWFVTIPINATGAANSTFQALLYEATGAVEFRYGAMGSTSGSSSCGLTGDATTYISVTHSAQTSSTITPNNGNAAQPATGTSYLFTPPALSYLWSSPASMSSTTLSAISSTPTVFTTYSVDLGYAGCVTTRTLSVNVTNPPTLTLSASNYSICQGNSSTLTASGATTYSWNNGATSSVTIVSPTLTSTIYTVTGITGPCVATNTISIEIPGNPTVTISGSSGICIGDNAMLIANGAVSYSWSTGATSSSIITTPATNTTYTVTGTDALGCSTSTTQLVNVATSLSISVTGPSVICEGQTANLTANGAVTYVWDTGATSASIAVNPVITTTYTVVGASGTCSNIATKVLTVNPNPTVAISGNTVVCVGLSTTLSASGASTYSWNTNATTNTIVSTPTTTTGYSVIGTSSLGCQGTATTAVATNSVPVINIAQSSSAICVGTSVTFTALGADTYSWSLGPNTSTLLLTPVVSDNYTISGTNLAGCISSATTNVVVNALPNLTITPTSPTVCLQSPVNLTASGANTFTWNSNNALNTAAVSFTPLGASVYTVVGTNASGCVNSQTVAVTTNSLPIVSITPSSATVCSQSPVTFTASGANTYLWNNVNITTASATLFPSTSTTYTVIGTSAQGCSSSATVAVTALSLPAVAVNPSFTTVCEFSTHTYTANGAVTYTWNSNNAITGSVVSLSTPSTSAYNVVGTGTNGCTNNAQVIVIASALPTISIVASSLTVCSLQPVQLDASGANSYTWSNGALTSSTVVNPLTSTVYSVTGQNTVTGCSSTQTTEVVANPLPTLTISPASPTVCINTPVTLNASGASSYLWSNNSGFSNITITPSVNVSYTVTGTDGLGCTNSTVVFVAVVPYPVISITPPSATVCTGETATFVASGANNYTWSAVGFVLSPTLTVTPATSGVYNVTGANLNNCKTSATATVVVDICTGIENKILADHGVKLYPNPTTGMFTARFDFEGEKTILIVNSIGQLILETVTSEMSHDFDLSGFAKGIYFVKVNSKQASGNYKLITD